MAARGKNAEKEQNRKNSKPAMEKKRRERINRALNTLKELVLTAQNKDISKHAKLEKADILELAVNHLKTLEEANKDNVNNGDGCNNYKEGFEKCLKEVEIYINSDISLDKFRARRLISHLRSLCMKLDPVPCKNLTHSDIKSENKVKAAIDTSVFLSPIISFQQSEEQHIPMALVTPRLLEEQQVPSPTSSPNNCYIKLEPDHSCKYSVTSTGFHTFPLSPSDSSRNSASPDSPRESPRIRLYPRRSCSPDYPHRTWLSQWNKYPRFSPLPEREDSKPLNLTVPSNSREEENTLTFNQGVNKPPFLPSPSSEITRRGGGTSTPPFHLNPNPIKAASGKEILPPTDNVTGNAPHPQGEGPSRASHSLLYSSWNRPAPYPKKEAVKRYQNRNPPSGDAAGEEGAQIQRRNIPHPEEQLPQSHWRPW